MYVLKYLSLNLQLKQFNKKYLVSITNRGDYDTATTTSSLSGLQTTKVYLSSAQYTICETTVDSLPLNHSRWGSNHPSTHQSTMSEGMIEVWSLKPDITCSGLEKTNTLCL